MTALPASASASVYIRRPSPSPSVPVALGARSVMWRTFLPGEYEDNAVRAWVKLLWVVRGAGLVRIEKRVLPVAAEQVALFLPGTRHEAWVSATASEPWEVHWLTLDGPLCAEMVHALGLHRAGVWQAGPVPGDLFEELRAAVAASVSPEGERFADVAAYAIFARVAGRVPPPVGSLIDRAIALLQNHWADADFGVEQLAHAAGVHRSVLSRQFASTVGLSPREYLANLRMQHALSLLRTTDLPIGEVARRCGFADPDYFTRRFRRVQGVAPGNFRRDQNA